MKYEGINDKTSWVWSKPEISAEELKDKIFNIIDLPLEKEKSAFKKFTDSIPPESFQSKGIKLF